MLRKGARWCTALLLTALHGAAGATAEGVPVGVVLPTIKAAANLEEARAHRARLTQYDTAGDYKGMGTYAVTLLEDLGDNYPLDGKLPSVHHYLGVAMYNLGFVDEAADAFLAAVRLVDSDLASWTHLTDCLLHRFRVKEACWAAESYTVVRNLTNDVSRLYKARSWIGDWTDRELMGDLLRRRVRREIAAGKRPSVGPAEYTEEVPPPLLLAMTRQMDQAAPAPAAEQHFGRGIASSDPRRWPAPLPGGGAGGRRPTTRRKALRIGFVSSDWGVHPVSTLMRGAISGLLALPDGALDVFCFSLIDGPAQDSWWRRNISATVGEATNFVSLAGMPAKAAAQKVRALRMHVLVDLNGHTMHTGLPVLAYRPAPLQISFLGSPLSTGASSIDYYMADAIVVPADAPAGGEDDGVSDLLPGGARAGVGSATRGYSERLVYHPACYFPTDHAQLHGHALTLPRPDRNTLEEPVAQLLRGAAEAAALDVSAPSAIFGSLHEEMRARTTEERGAEARIDWKHLAPEAPLDGASIARGRAFWKRYPVLIAAFTNYQKIDPAVFDAWMHVLQRAPRACLLFLRYGFGSHVHAQAHLRASAAERGVDPRRLVFSKQAPWLNHTLVKATADFVLDATLKNGHTTTADALWAGLPVVHMAGGQFGNRVAKSMSTTLGVGAHTEAHSFKDLGDVGARFARGDAVLRSVRRELERRRWHAPLFDTDGWAFSFQARTLAMWEVGRAAAALNVARRGLDALKAGDRGGGAAGLRPDLLPMHVFGTREDEEDRRRLRKWGQRYGEGDEPPLREAWKMTAHSALSLPDDADGAAEVKAAAQTVAASSGGAAGAGASAASAAAVGKVVPAPAPAPAPASVVPPLPLLLHIGGVTSKEGWTIVNAKAGAGVGIVAQMDRLDSLRNETADAVYASHVLEHAAYRELRGGAFAAAKRSPPPIGFSGISEVAAALREWYRVLKPGGALFVSVPDMRRLLQMYVRPDLGLNERFHVMRMLFGGQTDQHDFHSVGLDCETLTRFLKAAGFCEIRRLRRGFDLFNDGSQMQHLGTFISVNIHARACKPGEQVEVNFAANNKDVYYSEAEMATIGR